MEMRKSDLLGHGLSTASRDPLQIFVPVSSGLESEGLFPYTFSIWIFCLTLSLVAEALDGLGAAAGPLDLPGTKGSSPIRDSE